PAPAPLFRKLIRDPRIKTRNRNDGGALGQSRSDGSADSEDYPATLADHWRNLRGDFSDWSISPPGGIFSRLLGRLHGVAGSHSGIDGNPDAPAFDQGRMGHGNPSHSRRRHADSPVDDVAISPHLVRFAETVYLGASS